MLVEKQPARFSFLRQLVKLNLGSKGSLCNRRRRARPASSYAGGIKKCNNFVAVCIGKASFQGFRSLSGGRWFQNPLSGYNVFSLS
jgi:hypothetical protein